MEMNTGEIRNADICLVVIFNHRYDENITKLRIIYQNRFHKMRFLVPFYDGEDKDVIPVYECSYQFSGYLIQAYNKLIADGAKYYFFIADDLILAPDINEDNVLQLLKMQGREIFAISVNPLNSEGMCVWPHARFSSVPFLKERTQWKNSIPNYQDALDKFQLFFDQPYLEEYTDAFFKNGSEQISQKEKDDFIQRNGNGLAIPYPMAYGYSDIFMIKAEAFFPIARLCGVFSAMNMFAEISLPTAIVLSVPRSRVIFLADTGYNCKIEWDENRALIEEKCRLDSEHCMKNGIPQICLFIRSSCQNGR